MHSAISFHSKIQKLLTNTQRRRRRVTAACSVVRACEEEEARQRKKRKKEKERGFLKMTAYVEPSQEEEELLCRMRGEDDRADARGGEQRADACGREHRAVAVWGGQHRDQDLLSYVNESRNHGGCVAVWGWFQMLGLTVRGSNEKQ
ncbi:uncharacterized protein DS421_4g124060 [Arachis hypogaea]|nr:uncharacterized protein DS421_4g124060 [Arachis hypogaea]